MRKKQTFENPETGEFDMDILNQYLEECYREFDEAFERFAEIERELIGTPDEREKNE